MNAAKRAKLQDKSVASLIAIERNALTYAGHAVWNQRRKVKPTREDPRKTMEWRPRSDWMISEEPSHPAIIKRTEAERILAMVDAANPKPAKPRAVALMLRRDRASEARAVDLLRAPAKRFAFRAAARWRSPPEPPSAKAPRTA